MKTIIENDEKYGRKLSSRIGKPVINYLFVFHTLETVDNNRLSIFAVPEASGEMVGAFVIYVKGRESYSSNLEFNFNNYFLIHVNKFH